MRARATVSVGALIFLAACGGSGGSNTIATAISAQPASVSALAGTTATFDVAATGEQLTYQWQLSTDKTVSWTDLAGAALSSFTTAVLDASYNGFQYRVLVTGAGGAVTSSAATLTVAPVPTAITITAQPVDQTVAAGASASFSVTSTGSSLTYQWQSSIDGTTWTDQASAISATLSLISVAVSDSGKQYRVIVSNSVGSVTSNSGLLTVTSAPTAPTIATQPTDETTPAGGAATFLVIAAGTPSPNYQWQMSLDSGASFSNVNGATSSSYTTAIAAASDSGKRFRVVVSNSAGSVTSVAVTLTVSASATAAQHWLPFEALPTSSAATAGGQTGLFVVPSNAPSTAPLFLTHTPIKTFGATPSFTLSGNNISTYVPSKLTYAAGGSDGKAHVYSINLSNTAVTPSPVQLSNLAFPSIDSVCGYLSALSDQTDPTSLFIVLRLAGSTGCYTSGDTFMLMHYADGATGTPATVPAGSTSFRPIYRAGGALAGLVGPDASGSQMLFYSDASFTTPKTVATGSQARILYDRPSHTTGPYGPLKESFFNPADGLIFFSLMEGSSYSIYRLDVTGNATVVGTGFQDLDSYIVADDASLFVLDHGTNGPQIFQLDLGGSGNPLLLYTLTSTTTGATFSHLVGSNGSVLVFYLITNSGTVSAKSLIMTVPKGAQTSTATTLSSPLDGDISAFMLSSAVDDPANAKIFVDVLKSSGSGATAATSFSSEVLSPSGSVLQAPLANSLFPDYLSYPRLSAISDSVGQLKSITDTDGNYGGGSVYSVKISDLTPSAFHTPSGTPFVVPAETQFGLSTQAYGVSSLASDGGESSSAGGSSGPSVGLAFDLTQLLIVPISISNTNVGAAD